jgi:restriction system protein
MTIRIIYGNYNEMPSNTPNRTASPAIAALIVAVLIFLILSMAGNGLVDDNRQVSSKTSVAVLAVMKEARLWVAVGMGGLIYLWMWQLQKRQPAISEAEFIKWSAALPQWRPQNPAGETAVFLVPQTVNRPRAFAAAAPLPEKTAAREEEEAAPQKSVPVLRLAPLQAMAGRLAATQGAGLAPVVPVASALPPVVMPAPERTPLALQPVAPAAAALAKPGRLELPATLDLPALARLPRPEFEKMAGELYRRQGYDVAALGGGDDAGVDLIMTGRSEVLVAKCWLSPEPVPVEIVRELLALVMQEGATRGILITSGEFSRKAVKFAGSRGKHRLQLISGRQFQSLLAASAAGAAPACPCCGGRTLMVERPKRFGRSTRFWQCARAPECEGVIKAGGRSRTAPQPAGLLAA